MVGCDTENGGFWSSAPPTSGEGMFFGEDFLKEAASFQSKEFNILCHFLNWILEIQ